MRRVKNAELAAAGWVEGSADEFLNLSPAESAYLDLRERLAEYLRELRAEKKRTQQALAKELGSSQSRVAKMEAGDPSVSLDLLFRALLTLGASTKDLAKAIGSTRRVAA